MLAATSRQQERTIKVARLMRLVGASIRDFCATFALSSGIFPHRDHSHQGKSGRASPLSDLVHDMRAYRFCGRRRYPGDSRRTVEGQRQLMFHLHSCVEFLPRSLSGRIHLLAYGGGSSYRPPSSYTKTCRPPRDVRFFELGRLSPKVQNRLTPDKRQETGGFVS